MDDIRLLFTLLAKNMTNTRFDALYLSTDIATQEELDGAVSSRLSLSGGVLTGNLTIEKEDAKLAIADGGTTLSCGVEGLLAEDATGAVAYELPFDNGTISDDVEKYGVMQTFATREWVSSDLSGQDILYKSRGGIVSSEFGIYQTTLNVLSGNFVQSNSNNVLNYSAKNAFLQAEEAKSGSGKSYGVAYTGTKGYCILSVDKDENKIKLSGNVSAINNLLEGKYVDHEGNLLTSVYDTPALKILYSGAYNVNYGFNDIKFSFALDDRQGPASVKPVAVIESNNEYGIISVESLPSELTAGANGKTEDDMIDLFVKDDNAMYAIGYPELGNQLIHNFYAQHAEGGSVRAIGKYTHAEGRDTVADVRYAHAEGSHNIAAGMASHAEGFYNYAVGRYAHVEGQSSIALGKNSHAEGLSSIANGENSHAEGYMTSAIGNQSHAEGASGLANGVRSHAEGNKTLANAENTHAEGNAVSAYGNNAHAEGYQTLAYGSSSHAEGVYTVAGNTTSHSVNTDTAEGKFAHAEGNGTYAKGNSSHAEGIGTKATGQCSHSEGYNTVAAGKYSYAGGYQTSALDIGAFTTGMYNLAVLSSSSYSFTAGRGARSQNNYTFTWNGDIGSHNSQTNPYVSNGAGTFNINPKNGISGFFIGTESLSAIIRSSVEAILAEHGITT